MTNSPTYVSFLLAFIWLTTTVSNHGCMMKNANGTNKIIIGIDKFITLTDKCMWNYPCDVPNGVKTRSKTKNEPTADYKEVESAVK